MARVYVERREWPAELVRLLDTHADAAECSPPLDIVETDEGLELVLDLPGLPPSAIDVIFANNVVLIAGRKTPAACQHGDAAFHLAERAFGRFGRAISVDGAFDAGRFTATLIDGVLRIVLPRLGDRRGGQIRIPIRTR
jgi:HSP20 family protein